MGALNGVIALGFIVVVEWITLTPFMLFLEAANNPSGRNLLVVGFEGTGTNGSIGVFEVIPEPSSAMLAGLGALLAFRRRRNA